MIQTACISILLHNSTSSLGDSTQTAQETDDNLTECKQELKDPHKQ